MILYMIDTQGRARIAQLVKDEMARLGVSGPELGAKPGRPKLATINRIKAMDPKVSDEMLEGLGAKLGMPRGYLLYVGNADIGRIKESGAEADLIRWTLDLIGAVQLEPKSGKRRATG